MAFLDNIKSVEAFQALPRAIRNLVFYSEGPEYWPHLQPILRNILDVHKHPVVYLASSQEDPGLRVDTPLLKGFCIGAGGPRNELFRVLEADVLVMTTPDLDALYLKRSDRCRHYAYVFHSPVSTHMIYQPSAFDYYDSIFCVGPHHETEIRKREALTGAKPKLLFHHGYSRLDGILETAPEANPATQSGAPHVLIAPSWGPNGIFETIGDELVETLLNAGFRVTARPHPQTLKLTAPKIKNLEARFSDNGNFSLERNVASAESLFQSDVMISDWSGAAFDYAFGLLKPVLFLDTPRKINNPEYEQLQIEPLEAAIRNAIGRVIDPRHLEMLPVAVKEVAQNKTQWCDRILEERQKWIFNIGESGARAGSDLVKMASSLNLGLDAGDANSDDSVALAVKMIAESQPCPPSAEKIGDVASFAVCLLNSDAPLSSVQLNQLESLCRRIDVFKKLSAEYDDSFTKPVNKSPVEPAILAIMAYIFTTAATQLAQENLGRALKFLNTAGNALNLYMANDGVIGAPQIEGRIFQTYKLLGVST